MAYTFTRTGAQIEEIHNTVEDPKSNAQFSDDIRTITGEYRGLWPDTGGSANKGDTYQTQASGTPTGLYFTALQDTEVDPVGDNVNWRAIDRWAILAFETVADLQEGVGVGGVRVDLSEIPNNTLVTVGSNSTSYRRTGVTTPSNAGLLTDGERVVWSNNEGLQFVAVPTVTYRRQSELASTPRLPQKAVVISARTDLTQYDMYLVVPFDGQTEDGEDVIRLLAPNEDLALTKLTDFAENNAISALDAKYDKKGRTGISYFNPANLGHRAGKLIYSKDSTGRAELLTKLDKFMPVGWRVRNPAELPPSLKAYYVSRSGDNSDGLTWSTAYNTINSAMAQVDVDVIFVDGTNHFPIEFNGGTYSGSRDIAIISVGGRAIISPQRESTWSSGTEANTFISSALGGTPVIGIDPRQIDENGVPIRLNKLDTELEVSATPGSWTIIGTGGSQRAVVRLLDDAAPTNDNCWIMRSSPIRFSGVSCKHYWCGFDFYSGQAGAFSARDSDIDAVIAQEDCGYYQAIGDGYQIKGVGIAISIGCRAAQNTNDGFNYHANNNDALELNPHFIEIDSFGFRNLEPGTGNGSTSHEACVGFRINCDYFDNNGPGIADIDDTKTYNVSCTSNSNGLTSPDFNAYGASISGNAEAWFDGFAGDNNFGTVEIGARGNGTIHYQDCFPVPIDVDGTGTINQDFS